MDGYSSFGWFISERIARVLTRRIAILRITTTIIIITTTTLILQFSPPLTIPSIYFQLDLFPPHPEPNGFMRNVFCDLISPLGSM